MKISSTIYIRYKYFILKMKNSSTIYIARSSLTSFPSHQVGNINLRRQCNSCLRLSSLPSRYQPSHTSIFNKTTSQSSTTCFPSLSTQKKSKTSNTDSKYRFHTNRNKYNICHSLYICGLYRII